MKKFCVQVILTLIGIFVSFPLQAGQHDQSAVFAEKMLERKNQVRRQNFEPSPLIQTHSFNDSVYLLAQAETAGRDNADEITEEKEEGYTDEEIAEMINNPLGNLWLLFSQNDTVWWDGDALDELGENRKVFNSFLINPVMPMQLTENWKYIFRPIIPINSFDLPSGLSASHPDEPPSDDLPQNNLNFDRETGLGDIILWNAFSTNEGAKPPNIFGAGFTMMLDTATEDALGTGKWSAGPMALAIHLTDDWVVGGIFQHFESFAGSDSRNDVSLSDLQYILRYRLSPETNIGIAPNIRYNWEADSDDALTLPVGIGADTLIKIGPMPVKIGAEIYYYVEKPDAFGPEWQLRLLFAPVLPSPAWAKKPIFGN
ncbi:MAG: hypothetical protein AB1Z31_03265 [Desulfobacterales bacterium]